MERGVLFREVFSLQVLEKWFDENTSFLASLTHTLATVVLAYSEFEDVENGCKGLSLDDGGVM